MKGNPDPSENGISTRWKKGQPSPNPTAKPRGYGAFRRMCRALSPEALDALKAALKEPGERVSAAKVVLEYSWGKPPKREETAPTPTKLLEVREALLESISDELASADDKNTH